MKLVNDTGQARQRVKVALTGLAIVLVLIGLASLILGTAGRSRAPVVTAGGTPAHVALANAGDPSEPLAELGVTPSTQSNAAAPETAVP